MMRKLKAALFTCFLLGTIGAFAQTLETADSLFNSGKYTSALSAYTSLYDSGQTSESALLRMAYIHEGLGNYTQTLFYLNKLQQLKPERSTLLKMVELANTHRLKGYAVSDAVFFISFLRNYKYSIMFLLIALSLYLFVQTWFNSKHRKQNVGLLPLQLIFLGLLLVLNNDYFIPKHALVSEDTYIMSAPTSAAEMIEFVEKGHKLKILGTKGPWVRVIWNDQPVYIRDSRLLRL